MLNFESSNSSYFVDCAANFLITVMASDTVHSKKSLLLFLFKSLKKDELDPKYHCGLQQKRSIPQ